MRNRTKQYLHSMAKLILKDHPTVSAYFIGDWQKRKTVAKSDNMFVNKAINRAVQNNLPIGKLIDYLRNKALYNGVQVTKVNEAWTTCTCSKCDTVHKKLAPAQRIFTCSKCGLVAPRDNNATLNLMQRYFYGVWHALKDRMSFSSTRKWLDALTCVKTSCYRGSVTLMYSNAS